MKIRTALGAASLLLLAGNGAGAADMGLRGSIPAVEQVYQTPFTWTGIYGGLHVGVGTMAHDLQQAARSEATRQLLGTTFQSTGTGGVATTPISDLILIDPQRTSPRFFGGFLGYQMEVDSAVFGFEVDYTRLTGGNSATGSYTSPIALLYPNSSSGFTDSFSQTATVTSRVEDYFTLRGRMGYAFGRFMPYLTAGLALGRGQTTTTYAGTYTRIDTNTGDGVTWPPGPFTVGSGTRTVRSSLNPGLVAGVGMDALLLNNLFLRAEYQFVRFTNIAGIGATLHNARLGVALKY